MDIIIVGLLLAVGLTQCLPGLLLFAPSRIPAAYGIVVDGPDLTLLLRHRALLLAIPGLLVLVSAAVPDLRWTAIAACALSMGSFVAILAVTPGVNSQNRRVALVDVVAVAALVAVTLLLALD